MAGTAGIFTGTGCSSLHLEWGIPVIPVNTGMELIPMSNIRKHFAPSGFLV
jgi:hypothetical protein